MIYSDKELGSTIVDFAGEYAATHTTAHAPHSVSISHEPPKRERIHSGALHSTSFLCYDLKSNSAALQVIQLSRSEICVANFKAPLQIVLVKIGYLWQIGLSITRNR